MHNWGPHPVKFLLRLSQAFLQDLCGREGRKGDNNLIWEFLNSTTPTLLEGNVGNMIAITKDLLLAGLFYLPVYFIATTVDWGLL